MKHIAFLLVLSILFTSISYSTEVGMSAQAIIDARADASNDVIKTTWFMLGCCFGVFGYAVSLAETPEIPIDRFMGKPPEYVYFYSEEYQRKTKSIQSDYALRGWFAGVMIAGVIAFFISESQRN